MDIPRDEAAAVLRRAGLPDLAAALADEVPDPIDDVSLQHFCDRHNVSRDWLISRMGGSP